MSRTRKDQPTPPHVDQAKVDERTAKGTRRARGRKPKRRVVAGTAAARALGIGVGL